MQHIARRPTRRRLGRAWLVAIDTFVAAFPADPGNAVSLTLFMGGRRHGSGQQAALVLTVALAGCGGNVTVSRGFDSREVLPVRDPTLNLVYVSSDLEGQDPTVVYTTQPEDPGAPVYWSLNLTTGAVANLGASLPSPDAGAPATARYVCSTTDLMSDGSRTLDILDTSTGTTVDITGVTAFFNCGNDDGTLSVFRLDPDTGHQALWTGPFQQLAPVALPIDILRIDLFLADGNGQLAKVAVMGAPPGQSGGAGIFTIDAATSAVTQVVPATPDSAAWATGAPQAGSLQSTGVALNVDLSVSNGVYIYGRTMSDGGTTLFAGPFTSGPASELALFQISAAGTPALPSRVRVSAPDDAAQAQPAPRMRAWQVDGDGGAPSQLMVWDQAGGQVTACPSAPGAYESGVMAPDGAHVLFRALQLGGQLTFAPLQLLTVADGQPRTCVQLQDSSVIWADFSGDGSTIAWISKTQVGADTDLWIANSDGSDPKMILSGQIFGAGFVDGTNHLEMEKGGDFVWLDVRDPTHFSYVAEQLFGNPTGIGGFWYVAGYNFSGQDASGQLGLINLETAAKRPISPAVAEYLVSTQGTPFDGGVELGVTPTGVYHVVYLVRGRNPSPQDGIWLATVTAADLQ